MRDLGHEETEEVLKKIEKRISAEYRQAEREIAAKLDDYMKRFAEKDKLKLLGVANGQITEEEYKQWRLGQVMIGKRWSEMRDSLAKDFANTSQIARSIAFDHIPEVYAINHDYGTFQVEKGSLTDTSYTLYDRQSIEQLYKNEDTFIPAPGRKVKRAINEGKQIAWDKKQVQSAMMQGLLQGESIPNIATRLANSVGEGDRKAAIRNARTLTTGIENAGRVASYDRANAMGIKTKKQWLAALDMRTRHWHASLDGVSVENDKPFTNDYGKIMYPGDPSANPANIFNCRCTLIADIEGFENDLSDMSLRRNEKLGDMSYDEWKAGHYDMESDRITKQDEIAETMRYAYGSEYAKYQHYEKADIDNDLKMGARYDKINVEDVNIDRSDIIENYSSTEEILNLFEEIEFSEAFSEMSFEAQREIAQGMSFMCKTYGRAILPKKIIVADNLGGDMARYNTQTRIMKFKKNLDPGMALVSTCHECVHAVDTYNGNISEQVITDAYKRLGVRGKRTKEFMLYNSIGLRAITYKDDYAEQLAWIYESSLYSKKEDVFAKTVREIFDERCGVNHEKK